MAKNHTEDMEEIKNEHSTAEAEESTSSPEAADTSADSENSNPQETSEAEGTEAEKKDSELESALSQVAGLSDKLMRTAAEFDNYKKRTAREKDEYYKNAVCDTIAQLLPVLDNLERAVSAAENAGETGSVLDGIKMVQKQFCDALTSIGVEAIDAMGKEFDPERHNAVMTGEGGDKENTVIEEFQKGYLYKDKVIRHSMVKVSN